MEQKYKKKDNCLDTGFPDSLYLLDKILLLIFISILLSEYFLYFQNRIHLYVKTAERLQYKINYEDENE